jgi:restriction endonuclease Mrr
MTALDRNGLHQTIDELPDDILTELAWFVEFLQFKRQRVEQTDTDASARYSQSMPSHKLRERLAQDYDDLAAMYDELADELADEVWLPLENEASSRTESLTE